MTHRIDVARESGNLTFEVQGVLDAEALGELRAAVAAARATGAKARVLLRAGTKVERGCLPELRGMGAEAEVVAESPYLARWLAEAGSR